jgi:hypothetical protein
LLIISARLHAQLPEDPDTVRLAVEETALWDDFTPYVVDTEVEYRHLPPSYRPPFARILALLQVITDRSPMHNLFHHGAAYWHAYIFVKAIATAFPSGRYVRRQRSRSLAALLAVFSSCFRSRPDPVNGLDIEDLVSEWEKSLFLPQPVDKIFLEERYPAVNLTFEVGDASVSPPGREVGV